MRTLTLTLLVAIAWAASAADVAVPSNSATLSRDGLERREGKWFEEVWMRRFYDVRSYRKIILEPPHIEYRSEPAGSGATGSATPFLPSKEQKDALVDVVFAAFRDQLAQTKHFTLASEPGPDVLIVRDSLLDVASFAPPRAQSEDRQTFDIGDASLVLELYDSLSNAILVRVIGPVDAQDGGAETPAAIATIWATALRERLDTAASIPLNP